MYSKFEYILFCEENSACSTFDRMLIGVFEDVTFLGRLLYIS